MSYLSVHCRRAPKKSQVISIEVNNKLYKMYSVKKSWLEAVLDCEDRNSQIADVNSIEAKFLARAMLKHRPTIESVWIGGYEELSTEEVNKVEDCHLDKVAVLKSSCGKRRHVVCQYKNSFNSSEISSTTIIINISSIYPFKKNKTSNFIDNFSGNNKSYQILTSSVPSTPFSSTTVPAILFTTKVTALDSTEPRIKSITESLVRKNELQRSNVRNYSTEPRIKSITESLVRKNELQRRNFENNSKVKQIKYSNVPKLYYAFEGPLVGKLEDNNNSQLVDKKKLTHKYQKYISSQSLK
ncbi:Protein of unknown function, partial [Cotesia congregata]